MTEDVIIQTSKGPIELTSLQELADQLKQIILDYPELDSYSLDLLKESFDKTVFSTKNLPGMNGLLYEPQEITQAANTLIEHLIAHGFNVRQQFPELLALNIELYKYRDAYPALVQLKENDENIKISSKLIEGYEYFDPSLEGMGFGHRYSYIGNPVIETMAATIDGVRAQIPLTLGENLTVTTSDVDISDYMGLLRQRIHEDAKTFLIAKACDQMADETLPPEVVGESIKSVSENAYQVYLTTDQNLYNSQTLERVTDALVSDTFGESIKAISKTAYMTYQETDKDLKNPETLRIITGALIDDYHDKVSKMNADVAPGDNIIITLPKGAEAPQYLMVSPEENLNQIPILEWRIREYQGWWRTHNTIVAAGGHVTIGNGDEETGKATERWARDTFIPVVNQNRQLFIRNGSDVQQGNQEQAQELIVSALQNSEFTDLSINLEGGDTIYSPLHDTLFISLSTINFDRAVERDFTLGHMKNTLEQRLKEQGFNTKVVTLPTDELHKEKFYHLDTFFNVTPRGEAVIYPGAIKPETYDKVKTVFGKDNIIEMSYSEARNYPANFVAVGNTIIMPMISDNNQKCLIDDLKTKGYEVALVEGAVQDLRLSDVPGGIHCSVLDITLNPITSIEIDIKNSHQPSLLQQIPFRP